MKNSDLKASNQKQNFNIFVDTIKSITTIAVASGALFLIGFHVIPVFADKAPQIFSEDNANSQIVFNQEVSSVISNGAVSAEKKTVR